MSKGTTGGNSFPPVSLFAGSPAPLPPSSATDLEDQDTGDLPTGVNEDALDYDSLDTDTVTSSE